MAPEVGQNNPAKFVAANYSGCSYVHSERGEITAGVHHTATGPDLQGSNICQPSGHDGDTLGQLWGEVGAYVPSHGNSDHSIPPRISA